MLLNLARFAASNALLRIEALSMFVPLPISAKITFPLGSTVIIITIRPSS